jgi:hypothetical protein
MPPTLTQAHPPIDLDELVGEIRGFSAAGDRKQAALIKRLVDVHPTLNVLWGPGWKFKRARELSAGEEVRCIDDVIWRKHGMPKPGRANAAGVSIMYVADRRDTALTEARVDASWVALAEFVIRTGRSISIVPIGELAQVVRTGRGFLSGNASTVLSGVINACPLREARSLLITDAFLYNLMTADDNYTLSSQVAAAIFEKLDNVSAIAYSSRRQPSAINLALKSETFWDNWGVVSVRRGYAKHLALGFYQLSKVRLVKGIYESGKFDWNTSDEVGEGNNLLDPPYSPVHA